MSSAPFSPASDTCFSRRSELTGGDPPISVLMAKAIAEPNLISLAAGFVDSGSLPCDLVREATERVLGDPQRGRTALQYGTTAGFAPLRQLLIERLASQDGVTPRDGLARTICTAGSNQLLQLVTEALLDEGDVVLCAAPTYLVYLGTIAGVGGVSVSVATDEDGIVPEALDETLQGFRDRGEIERVKAIYCVSYFDNPRGTSLAPHRRAEILEIARRHSVAGPIRIIDDLAYRDLRYDGGDSPSFAALDPAGEHVIVAGTFSKSFAPGVRVGWGLMPRELAVRVERLKGNVDFGSPHLNQVLLHELLVSGAHERQVERLCTTYRAKRDAMLAALETEFGNEAEVRWVRPDGGLYVWLTLPESVDAGPAGRLLDAAVAEGVLYVPGQYAYAADGAEIRRNTIRLSFGVQSPERIGDGIAALARAVRQVR